MRDQILQICRSGRHLAAWVATASVALASSLTPVIALAEDNAAEPTFETLATTSAVINEFTSSASGATTEFIELMNPTAAAQDISGWTLATSTATIQTFPASTVLPANGLTSVSFVGQLSDTSDTLTLKTNTGTQVDQIRYGTGRQAQLRAPAAGKAAGRRADGAATWYVNLNPTPGSANGSGLALVPPTASRIRVNATIPADTINRFNMSTAQADVTLPASSLTTSSVTVDLVDGLDVAKSATATATNGAGTVTITGIDTTAAPALTDGLLVLRSFVTDSTGTSTSYAAGTNGARDTVAPASPTSVAILAEAGKNNANIINSLNASAVTTSVTLPASTASIDSVRVEANDGTRIASQTVTTPTGGGTFALTKTLDAISLADGTIVVTARLIDTAGNLSNPSPVINASKETAVPTASFTANGGATVSQTNQVNLTITASDVGSGVSQMRIGTTSDFAGATFEPFAASKTFTLPAIDGFRTIFLQVVDTAGNPSAIVSRSILVESDAESITQPAVASGTQTIRTLPMEVTVTGTSPTSLTLARYKTNPGTTSFPTGLTAVSRFIEVGAADSTKITFPILVKLFYTTDELRAAGITSESQLQGLSFFDQSTQTWKLYSSGGVVAADVTVDGQAFAGYFFANADHLTPMTGVGDTTAPAAPGNLTANAGDGSVELSWEAVTDAASYTVRYRPASDASSAYTAVTLAATLRSTKVTNLTNGTRYEFGVASSDGAGNQSSFTTVTATPTAPVVAQLPHEPVILAPRAQAAPLIRPTPQVTATPTPTDSPSPTDRDDDQRARDLSRLLTILAILVIAVGAGTAGFYGYQWWALRNEEVGEIPAPPESVESTPAPKPKEPPVPPPTGRW